MQEEVKVKAVKKVWTKPVIKTERPLTAAEIAALQQQAETTLSY